MPSASLICRSRFDYLQSRSKFYLRNISTKKTKYTDPSVCFCQPRRPNPQCPLLWKQGFSKVLEEEQLTDDNLLNTIQDTYHNRQKYIASMEQSTLNDAVSVVMDLISSYGETWSCSKKYFSRPIRKIFWIRLIRLLEKDRPFLWNLLSPLRLDSNAFSNTFLPCTIWLCMLLRWRPRSG